MSQPDNTQFLVFGNSLAASMTVLALSKTLPKNISVKWVKPAASSTSDMLYGGISSPEAYQFNLKYGVTEPQLILETDSTFSFGTHFNEWGNHNRTWMQCFHLPFAATAGVELHHFMTRHGTSLGDFLISAQAAMKGTFAHPPTDNLQSPLSRAEYGYHFDPVQWSAVFYKQTDKTRIEIIHGDITRVKQSQNQGENQNQIDYVELDDGTKQQADLYIDCSGTDSKLLASLAEDFVKQRAVNISTDTHAVGQTGPAYRLISGGESGWQSVTPLRDNNQILSLFESSTDRENENCQTFELGRRRQAWKGNCLGIGHSVYALEPITPAAYILLKKDIERFLELIPVKPETHIESQEYNRRAQDDIIHAELFHRAMYAGQGELGDVDCEKLDRKLSQYLHRGIVAAYDFEPFNQQDWAILHAGLGRVPKRYDRMAEQVDFQQTQKNLDRMRAGIAHLAASMPAHHVYLEKLTTYLRNSDKHG
ncbi:tryptophan 7-halogenase [Paraglaciecola arctica]|uniref:tryptophan 7-halogenase n=1 Tax=Paraglaciecola arctica TaxID=1128911 RepID=UPI001C0740C3|nr:tryptophan 7-halogenase [Paraglaciecola arctica]MBU3005994.1 tryptophan 7-halogenase [Paraglaciecola arctica]